MKGRTQLNLALTEAIANILDQPMYSINPNGDLTTNEGFKQTPSIEEAKKVIEAVLSIIKTYAINDVDRYGLIPTGLLISVATVDEDNEELRDYSTFVIGTVDTKSYLINQIINDQP